MSWRRIGRARRISRSPAGSSRRLPPDRRGHRNEAIRDLSYDWRAPVPEETLRVFALRLADAQLVKMTPQEVIAINALGGLDWQFVIVVSSTLTIAGGLIAEFAVRDGPFPFPRATLDPRQAGRVLANRGVRLASFGYFGHMWELFAMYAWFLVFFSDQLAARGGSGGTPAAYATFAVIAVGALGCWAGGILGDRWGRTRTTALAMATSGTCAVLIGFVFDAPTWMVLLVGLVWGFAVVADSAQFSTMVTELADQAYVGTALTLQLAGGFVLTAATIWLIPFLKDAVGWRWAFAFLAIGPALGVLAMLRLKTLPEARRIAGGLG
jgi:predicted MFS family arabinose efflux permease